MGWWKELPYRGDGQPRNRKPRKRFRNLKKEKRENIVSILVIVVFFSIPLGLFIFGQSPYDSSGTSRIGSLIAIALLMLVLIIGILSISKFRKGYDVDISAETKKEDDHSSDHETS